MSKFLERIDYECRDLNEKELKMRERIIDLENKDQKQDQQRKMAAISLGGIIALTVFLMLPVLSNDRIEALDDIFTMFYVANAGVVAAFFGANAYMTVNR